MGSEKSFDSFLGIETIAETAFGDMDVCLPVNEEDNNYEVTYYNDLVTMFDEISMEPEDTLVDFGCGLGRVLFYCNSRHYCRTVGIENNARVYDRLLTNAASYQSKFLDQEERMQFLNVEAEAYEIGDEDNYFYFFNPFSSATFKKVLDNIIASVRRQPRDIELLIEKIVVNEDGMPEITLKYGLSNLISYSPADEMNRRENTIIAVVMKLIAEDERGYTSAKYLSEHITDLGFKKTKQSILPYIELMKGLGILEPTDNPLKPYNIVKSKEAIEQLAKDYLPDLTAEITAKQISDDYLHGISDNRWYAGNGI